MKRMKKVTTVAFVLFFAAALPLSWAEDTAVDHSLYAELLQKYVQDGVVDYQGLKTEEQKLDQYLGILNKTNPENLSRDEQLAFYINAYNAYTLKLILKHYPVESIKDIGGFFSKPWSIEFANVGGKTLTLDQIEHDIIRPRFQDPRIHFAVNCAAKSCPPLISEPYKGATIDQQLDESTRAFLNDPEKTYLEGDTLWVTRIFKWYSGDFNDDPLGFVLKYAEGEFKEQLEARKDEIEVEYLDYDWSLNEA